MKFGKYMWALHFLFALTQINTSAQATLLSDYTPYSYEVLFTNPTCKDYFYQKEVEARNGEILLQKPKDVYCKETDFQVSAQRKQSPHHRLLEWINDSNTREIFMAYFSFSNAGVKEALCQAIEKRNVKVTFVIHKESDKKLVNELAKCRPDENLFPEGQNLPTVLFKGGSGGNGRGTIGFAHNKITLINPHDSYELRLVFGSANMSSGTALHHENWSFVRTSPQSYLAQSHLCLMNGILYHDADKTTYREFLDKCRLEIKVPQEEDIQAFFVPGDKKEIIESIKTASAQANAFWVGAHRFSNKTLINILKEKLGERAEVKLVVDDDIYWSGMQRRAVGNNTVLEYDHVKSLVDLGAQTHYMETNHNARLLHHNKFVIFRGGEKTGVFAGAGNLTESGFDDNMENFYFITIPEVTAAYERQYLHLWENLSTSFERMPKEMVMP